ncbi:MarR family transcriptional regulator [Scandinavium sp. NPDC088450]|uniref:MarR family transcriptional regulator n=1 Tax=Scandinavium sp. NPDC088450 TaxID=3364514 RepID=UPI00384DD1F0
MNILNESLLVNYQQLFPELTPWQLEIVVLYSSGFNQNEIARIKNISKQAVSKALNEGKKRYHLEKVESIRSVFIARRLSNIPFCS